MAVRGKLRDIPFERLQLNLFNPRHEEMEGRDEAMIALLLKEQVVELARDIVRLGGINPMERMGVFLLDGTGDADSEFYAVAEGNRRLCALLLLDDPEAVPAAMSNRARYVRTFTQLSQQLDPLVDIPCVIFDDLESAQPWLERLHNGARDGTGRRSWTPEQQARNTSDRTNRAATQLRDLAISLGLVSSEDLARTTTTQQRFISTARFRQAMGLVRLEDGSLERTSCWADFLAMLEQFMNDIVNGVINSRSHNSRAQIEDYAQGLENLEGLDRRNIAQGPLEQINDEAENGSSGTGTDGTPGGGPDNNTSGQDNDNEDDADDSSDNKNPRPRMRNTINPDDEVLAALHRLRNQKLTDLYQSLSTVRLPQHTLLAVIGCWSFFESMTQHHGRTGSTNFVSYINANVQSLGVETSPSKSARKMALEWIQLGGNVTKYDWQAASYDRQQLCNTMDVLKPIIVAMIDDIADRNSES